MNNKEGDLTLSLANYIMQQGYKSDEVTILTAYSGQMFYMKKVCIPWSCRIVVLSDCESEGIESVPVCAHTFSNLTFSYFQATYIFKLIKYLF